MSQGNGEKNETIECMSGRLSWWLGGRRSQPTWWCPSPRVALAGRWGWSWSAPDACACRGMRRTCSQRPATCTWRPAAASNSPLLSSQYLLVRCSLPPLYPLSLPSKYPIFSTGIFVTCRKYEDLLHVYHVRDLRNLLYKRLRLKPEASDKKGAVGQLTYAYLFGLGLCDR